MSNVKFFNDDIDAKIFCKSHNKSLSRKSFHKYFFVVIDGPDDNYAVVDFKTARDMNVNYSVFW